ncbi:YheC/YheD family protein [Desulfuribacillus alkaliarsenatis]|uniref:ATP-grasp domain-containing protein n=1 Tax=Desulfuribacillus alkaliarsenatis TaxID=766136 RepID=A0A1E5FZJ4_9FIRM|nr:YheC/YheD family protein [Desulfuribacillus alkaliarsenatis]OEF95996.1 hypothetical protein BHF68_09605 [Desulfuribacillus alkaliarsenatis]
MEIINKWTMYEKLIKSRHIDIFLPETALITKPEIVFDMLYCYKSVFIKPCVGYGGNYIIHIFKIKRDLFKFYYYTKENIYTKTISYIELETLILKQIYCRQCIVQRDVKLAKYKGAYTNIRVRVEKHIEKSWKCTRILGKVATKELTITSIDFGATVVSYDKLSFSCSIDKSLVQLELYDLSIHVVKHLSKIHDYSCTCVWGLDLAIDHCGGIWFIDACLYDNITVKPGNFKERCIITLDQSINFLAELRRLLK